MTSSIEFPTLYLSAPHDCPYIPGEAATSLLLDPASPVSDQMFSVAIESGFRRSGKTVYRPHCAECQACKSVKIDVQNSRLNRSQKRTLKRNRDIHTQFVEPMFDEQHFQLYCRYQAWKHPGDSMDHGDRLKYEDSLIRSSVQSVFLEFYLEQKLVAISVVDVAAQGLSAVYTFFEPELAGRSLGRFAVLTLINKVREMGLNYVYLGYWIKDCEKMSYKSEYRPLLMYDGRGWVGFHQKAGLI
ncbi:MAG: arginyltransferase [Proteobacteria bacterium]|nr:arginyltransferase [Pseudomonadota bacterium]